MIDGQRRQRRAAGRARARDGVPVLRALSAHDASRDNIAFGLKHGRRCRRPRSTRKVAEAAAHPATSTQLSRPQAQASSPAASASASPSAAPSCASPRSSCSTSRCPTSTPRCACRCASRSPSCTTSSATTMIYVTHDQVEAMTMADKIVVLQRRHHRAGRLAARALPPPAQPVRRRLHRLPEDELPAGQGDGSRRGGRHGSAGRRVDASRSRSSPAG